MDMETVVIQTKLGQLRGSIRQSSLTEKPFYAFQGIPYGKPPLGELRFKPPQPFRGWGGVRDALKDGPAPKQPVMLPIPGENNENPAKGDEDCLYLNVFINEIPDEITLRKPVIVSIHGGGFQGGSGDFKGAGPDYLLCGDVVFVSFNYRCGAFGFLSLENEEVPGNAGLKDQTLVLKWIHDNIDSFGGDPNNVTIMGLSAGGASVEYHLLSPPSRGLFHKAIMQSGSAMNPWAFQPNPQANALKLAMTLGCMSEDPNEVVRFLQSVPADDIVVATKKMVDYKASLNSFIFSPSVEVSGVESSLPDNPKTLMMRGEFVSVPVIVGCCVKEGNVSAYGIRDSAFEKINRNHEGLVPSFLELKSGSIEEREAAKVIWDFYFQGNSLSWDNINDYLLYESDYQFNIGIEQTRSYLVQKSSAPVYTYLFTNHSRCMCSILPFLPPEHAAKVNSSDTCHCADYWYLYSFTSMETPKLTPVDKEAVIKHVKAWTYFASTGDPNCEKLGTIWRKDSGTNPCYMDIGVTWKMTDGLRLQDRTTFWKKLSLKYCNA